MSEPAPLNATFFAFQKREPGGVLTRAAIGYLLAYLIYVIAYLGIMWWLGRDFIAWYFEVLGSVSRGEEPTAPAPSVVWNVLPAMAVSGVIGLLITAAFEAASLRWLTRGEHGGGFLGLKLNADTLRVFAIYWIWLLLFIAMSVAIAALYVGLRAIASTSEALQIVVLLLAALAPLALIAVVIWIAVRLAPASALSVADQRLRFFGAWGVTRGRFWPILGAFVILIIGYSVISWIMQSLLQIPLSQPMAELMAGAMRDASGQETLNRLISTMSSPMFLAFVAVYTVASTILAVVFYIALYGVNARAILASREAPTPASSA